MTAQALRVFISYARRDGEAFAQELLTGLEIAGFDAFLDKHDIAAGEDWQVRLSNLIQAADTMVFVVTPCSAASERCAQEVALAQGLSKRIIPVVAIDAPEAETATALARLNYIYFTEGHSFTRALADLARALRVDLDWIREHTRLAEVAARWRDRDRSELLLMRGGELSAAQIWMQAWKAGAPEPTDLHRVYISESERAEQARANDERERLVVLAEAQEARELAFKRLSRRTTIGLIGLGGLVAVSAGAAAVAIGERSAREAAEARSIETLIEREAARTDLRGQLSMTTGTMRQGASALDESSTYGAMLREELRDRDNSVLQAIERVNRRLDAPNRPYRLISDINGAIYLARASALRRRAFVVSMDEVGGRRFASPQRDADQWAEMFEAMSFAVERLVNPTAAALVAAVAQPAEPGWLNVLYFAGGGVWVDGDEYLLAMDSTFAARDEVQLSAVPHTTIAQLIAGGSQSNPSILILDTSFVDFRLAAF